MMDETRTEKRLEHLATFKTCWFALMNEIEWMMNLQTIWKMMAVRFLYFQFGSIQVAIFPPQVGGCGVTIASCTERTYCWSFYL